MFDRVKPVLLCLDGCYRASRDEDEDEKPDVVPNFDTGRTSPKIKVFK